MKNLKYMSLIVLFFNQSYSAEIKKVQVKQKQVRCLTEKQKNILRQFKQVHFQELLEAIYTNMGSNKYQHNLDGIRSMCADSNHAVFSEIIDHWLTENLDGKIDSLNMCGCNILGFNNQQINWDVFPGVNVAWNAQEKQQYVIEYIIKNSDFVSATRMKNLRREFQKMIISCIDSGHKLYSPIIKDYLRQKKDHCICKFLANNKTQSVQLVAGQDFENFQEESNKNCGCVVM